MAAAAAHIETKTEEEMEMEVAVTETHVEFALRHVEFAVLQAFLSARGGRLPPREIRTWFDKPENKAMLQDAAEQIAEAIPYGKLGAMSNADLTWLLMEEFPVLWRSVRRARMGKVFQLSVIRENGTEAHLGTYLAKDLTEMLQIVLILWRGRSLDELKGVDGWLAAEGVVLPAEATAAEKEAAIWEILRVGTVEKQASFLEAIRGSLRIVEG
jgi:hypothetical protein